MKNKIFSIITIITMLVTASPTFAKGHFRAFDGVPTEEVSEAELNQISAEGRFNFTNAWRSTANTAKKVRPVWMAAQIGLQAYDIGQAIGFAASCVTMPNQCTPENVPTWRAPINYAIGYTTRR